MNLTKTYISAQSLLTDSFKLGRKIIESDFRPTHIVGLWRGGAPVGITVQEMLKFHGVETDHIAVRTSSYTGINQQSDVHVHGESYLVDALNTDDKLLIVDDVFESGRSIEALLRVLKTKCRANFPKEVKIATPYYKPTLNKTNLVPDFYLHETSDWLVFPHEICGLTAEEIRENKSMAKEILGEDF